MEKASLNEREQIVLQAVVHTFVTTAEPVGSRSIVKRYGLEWSAATVRNVMSDLEEYGFLQQLHTSSGRVPTNRGYRYYVDYLMRVQELTLAERRRIERELSAKLDDADEILRQTSHMLALVSHQTGLAEAPQDADVLVRSIELMPLTPSRLAVLMADNYGRVQTSMVTLANALNEAERQRVRSFLNETLRDVSIGNIQQSVQDRLSEAQDSTLWVRERALEIVKPLPGERPGQLYLEGAGHLFEQPEFNDMEKARGVFTLLEERERLVRLLRESMQTGSMRQVVLIGSDVNGEGLEELSVVASPYYMGDKPVGMLGVLGPRRMHYSKLSAVVDYTARMVSNFLTRLVN